MIDDKIRKTGIDIIGDISWGTHICLFYQTTNDLIDILVPYFKAGLENNEFCMWITSDPLNAVDAKRSLERVVKNLDDCLQRGQIEILDYRQWYIQSGEFNAGRVLRGWVEKERQAVQSGWDGLRLTGNTFWLEKGDWKEFIEYERMVDHVIDEYRMIAICTYFLDKCGASEVIDVVSNHQSALVKRGGRWEIIESAERKRAKQSQSESEERFHAVAKSANEAIVITDNKWKIVSWNKGAQRIFLYNEEEILGQNVSVLMPERYRALHLEAIKLLNSNGQTRLIGKTYEAHGLRKDGSEFPIEISLAEGKTAKSKIYAAIMRDITERKRAEEALRYQATLLTNLNDAVIASDEQYRITAWNPAAELIYGWKAEEVLGRFGLDITQTEYPGVDKEAMLRSIAELGQWCGEVTQVRKDGSRFPMEISSIVLRDENGRITGYLSLNRDITERKRAEQGLKLQSQVLENMVEGVNVSDENGIIIFNNPAFEIMFGYAPGELIGQHVSLLLNGSPEENLRRVSEIIAQLRTKGTWLGEFSNRKKDGIPFTTYARISTLELSGNKYWISVQEDITERKRVEEAEREQHALAEALCDTAVALNSTLHLDVVLDRILTNVGRVVPFDAVNIMLVESGIARTIRHQGYKEHGLEGFVDQVRFDLGDLAGLHYMTETKRPIVIPDTQTFTQWVDIPELRWIRSYVSSPICIKGETVGFLNLDSTTPRFFTPVHAKRLESFAAQAAIAIENAQLYEEIETRHRYLGTLLRINAALRSTLPPNIVLETISRSAGEALGYVGSLITVPDGNNERLILGSIWGSHFLEAAVQFTGLKVESFSLPIAAEGNTIIHSVPEWRDPVTE